MKMAEVNIFRIYIALWNINTKDKRISYFMSILVSAAEFDELKVQNEINLSIFSEILLFFLEFP